MNKNNFHLLTTSTNICKHSPLSLRLSIWIPIIEDSCFDLFNIFSGGILRTSQKKSKLAKEMLVLWKKVKKIILVIWYWFKKYLNSKYLLIICTIEWSVELILLRLILHIFNYTRKIAEDIFWQNLIGKSFKL